MDVAVVEPLIRTEAAADTSVWTVHGQDTLPKLFRQVVAQRGDKVAQREKDLGIWRPISWREYGEKAKHVGLGLVALGLRHGDVVSIIADNCPEWLFTDMGVLSVGGVTNGIYTTDSPSQVEYIVNDSGTRFFFAENEEQLDKILEVRSRCPELSKIFLFDMEGLHKYRDDQVMAFGALLELGAAYVGGDCQLRREPRHPARQPPRGRAGPVFRGAEGMGEILLWCRAAHEGSNAAR